MQCFSSELCAMIAANNKLIHESSFDDLDVSKPEVGIHPDDS